MTGVTFRAGFLCARVVGDGAARAVRRVIGVLAPLQASQSDQTQKAGQTPQAVVAAVVFGRLLLRLRQGRRGGCGFERVTRRDTHAAKQQGQCGGSDSRSWACSFFLLLM